MKVPNIRQAFFHRYNDIYGRENQLIKVQDAPRYVAPEKDEVHNDDPLTEAEVKALADKEKAFQTAKKSV